jgi:hypothetical protein
MSDHNTPTIEVKRDFNLCVDRYDCALRDIVRHLARISAEEDYKALLNERNLQYHVDEMKGPSS